MAIAKLDFNRGQAVNPLSDVGDDLLKYGASLHQQEKDRLAAEKQNELLNMQKAEHQMKVDAEKRALEELANTKAFNVELAKPREMAEAYAIYNQINNPLLQKQINDIAYSPNDTEADTARKTQAQEALGILGSTMASDPAYQETRLQQGTRLLAAMGDKAPLSAIKQVEEMRATEIASETAKAKDAREAASKSQDDLVKFLIEVAKLEGRNGTTITADDGTVLSLGGKSKVPSKFDFNEAQTELQNKASDAGYEKLSSKIEAAGRGKLKDLTDKQQDMLRKSFYNYVGAGYKPGEVADAVFASLPKELAWWEAWKKNPTEIKLSDDTLDSLAPGKEGLAKERAAQLETAQYNHILAQVKSAGGSGKNILEAYAPYYQGRIAKADAESKLLAMPLEKRQMQATANAIERILTPKKDTETASTQSSAKTINPTNIVPKQKESFDATVDRVVDYHKATPATGYALATMALLESEFEPNVKGDKGSAQGIYQHRLDRLDALKKFGNTDDVSKIPAEVQTDFAVKELRERPATPQFEKEYRKTNPNAGFVSQWDELNSKKTAGEAAAYLSEHFEVAKGASKNPNIKEAMKEEAARRGKIADEIFGADHDEFRQNKRKVNKAEEEMLKNGPEVLPTQEKSKIQQLFAEASTAPDAPIMPKVTSKTVPKPGYKLLAEAAVDVGKTAKSMIMQSPVGMLFNGNSVLKPVAAVLNNTAAGMLQIAGSPYTATKLFTDWMVTGKTEDSAFDANAKQAYATAVTALNEYGIKNPTEQQIIMLVSDMMAPSGAAKTVKGILPKAVDISEEALANILKSIKNGAGTNAPTPVGTPTLVSGGSKLNILADEAARLARSPATPANKIELQKILDRVPRMPNGKYGEAEQSIVDGIVYLLNR